MPDKKSTRKDIVWTPETVGKFWQAVSTSRLQELYFSRLAGKSLYVAISHLLPGPDGTVLDFGAGDGDFLEILCSRGQRAAAYEPSPERRQQIAQRLKNAPGFLGSIGPEDRQQFDCVIMAEVIEHILDSDFDAVLTRVSELTRPGGIVVVTTPHNEDLDLNMCYCPVSDLWFHRWQHVRSFTVESLTQTMARFGISEMASHKIDFTESYFLPYDPVWCEHGPLPARAHMRALRANTPAYCGNESHILFIGQKRPPLSRR